jgi:hypothetical protein
MMICSRKPVAVEHGLGTAHEAVEFVAGRVVAIMSCR